jgi:hypothetical protein
MQIFGINHSGVPGVVAHLGEVLSPEEFEREFPRLYQCIDLINEQIFLRMNGRISRATWRNWQEGIKSNLERPDFAKARALIKKGATGSFTELRKLEVSGLSDDPRKWVAAWKRLCR